MDINLKKRFYHDMILLAIRYLLLTLLLKYKELHATLICKPIEIKRFETNPQL